MARKKPARRDDSDADDAPPKPKSDAYVGLLAISLLALIVGCVFMHLDHDELAKASIPQPDIKVSASGLGMPKAGAPAPKS